MTHHVSCHKKIFKYLLVVLMNENALKLLYVCQSLILEVCKFCTVRVLRALYLYVPDILTDAPLFLETSIKKTICKN